MHQCMHQLPDLVAAAVKTGLASTKTLSWKVQEGEKALLLQLRWKPVTSVTIGGSLNSKVLSNSDTSGQKQKKNPSKKRRDAIRLKKFILSKHCNSMEPKVVTEVDQSPAGDTGQIRCRDSPQPDSVESCQAVQGKLGSSPMEVLTPILALEKPVPKTVLSWIFPASLCRTMLLLFRQTIYFSQGQLCYCMARR